MPWFKKIKIPEIKIRVPEVPVFLKFGKKARRSAPGEKREDGKIGSFFKRVFGREKSDSAPSQAARKRAGFVNRFTSAAESFFGKKTKVKNAIGRVLKKYKIAKYKIPANYDIAKTAVSLRDFVLMNSEADPVKLFSDIAGGIRKIDPAMAAEFQSALPGKPVRNPLFLCYMNKDRSVLGELLISEWVLQEYPRENFTVKSAGTADPNLLGKSKFFGESKTRYYVYLGKEPRILSITHKCRRITPELIENADVVFATPEAHAIALKEHPAAQNKLIRIELEIPYTVDETKGCLKKLGVSSQSIENIFSQIPDSSFYVGVDAGILSPYKKAFKYIKGREALRKAFGEKENGKLPAAPSQAAPAKARKRAAGAIGGDAAVIDSVHAFISDFIIKAENAFNAEWESANYKDIYRPIGKTHIPQLAFEKLKFIRAAFEKELSKTGFAGGRLLRKLCKKDPELIQELFACISGLDSREVFISKFMNRLKSHMKGKSTK